LIHPPILAEFNLLEGTFASFKSAVAGVIPVSLRSFAFPGEHPILDTLLYILMIFFQSLLQADATNLTDAFNAIEQAIQVWIDRGVAAYSPY
jgi:hypothetical protein